LGHFIHHSQFDEDFLKNIKNTVDTVDTSDTVDTVDRATDPKQKLQNISVSEDLHRLLKAKAAREGRKLRAMVADALWDLVGGRCDLTLGEPKEAQPLKEDRSHENPDS
jgi:hypothetical protein